MLSFEAGAKECGSRVDLRSILSGCLHSRNKCICLRSARLVACMYIARFARNKGDSRKVQTSHKGRTTASTNKERGKSELTVRKGRLDEPQAAAYCPDRYNRSDLHECEEQQQHPKISVSYQRRRQAHLQEISPNGSKNETSRQIRSDGRSPTQAILNKQKLEKLSQRHRNSIFAIARAKLSSFINRLSVSSGAGCAATRILTNTSNITSTSNNDLSSVISFPLRRNYHQNTIQMRPHSSTIQSFTAPALLSSSSIQANISLPSSTVLPDSGVSDSCCSTGSISTNVHNELQVAKSPVTTALLHQCNALPYLNNDGEYQHHLQKQKSTASSTSCSFFRQSNYPAAVYLTDGENSYLGMEHLVPREESERWIRAPPNCNPFDMRASFTCSSLSCRARITRPTYGRSRLNTATGIERPSSGGVVMTVRDNECRDRKCTEQVRSNDSLLADCRQHEDGCFSSHLRWLSMKEFSENRSQFDSRPVVYVPVLCESVCDRSIHHAVTNSITSDDSNNFINKPLSSSPSSSSLLLLQQTSITTFPSTSKFASANVVDTNVSDCTSIPVNYNSDMITHRPSNKKSDSPEEETEEEKEKIEKLKNEIITEMSARKVRTKVRCKTMEEMDCLVAASASTGQTKVVEYFRTVHRDPVKKFKHFKVFAENEEKNTEHILESPKKMARLKLPQTPSLDKKIESTNRKWVLPTTCLMSDKTEIASKSDEIKENNNHDEKSSLKVTENSKPTMYLTEKLTETEVNGEKEMKHDKIKRDMNNAFARPPETETNKAHSIDFSILPSAVRLVKNIKGNTESNLSDALPLPTKYERLLRLFDYTEVVVSWLETQGKRITLNEVMTNVQRKLKSNYDEQQFAMILSVYPESYNVHCERRWMPIGGRHSNLNEYEYVIEPNRINDLVFSLKENVKETSKSRSSPTKPILDSSYNLPITSFVRNAMVSSSMRTFAKSPVKSFYGLDVITRCPPKLESRRLRRKLEFRNRLRKLVNVQHAAFLKNEGIEISPDEQLPRYHPDFDLDAVDDIIPAKLPEMPEGDAGQPETMREYLKTVPDSSNTLPEKIKMVIKELRSPEKKVAVVADRCIPLSPQKYHVEKKNGLESNLLERIRAKERERKHREMMRNPEMIQKKGRLEKISHSLLQCICSYYNLKKVGSMKFTELIDKLAFGIGNISKVEIEAAVSLLCEVSPAYFKMVEVRGEKYIHLKDNNFSAIRDIVNAEIKECV